MSDNSFFGKWIGDHKFSSVDSVSFWIQALNKFSLGWFSKLNSFLMILTNISYHRMSRQGFQEDRNRQFTCLLFWKAKFWKLSRQTNNSCVEFRRHFSKSFRNIIWCTSLTRRIAIFVCFQKNQQTVFSSCKIHKFVSASTRWRIR